MSVKLETFPSFPEDVHTHPLLVIDYGLIQAGDEEESEKLWTAGRELGFWYLKNHGANDEVAGMFQMGEETMALPLQEKLRYEQGDEGVSFGYKAAGANATDEHGSLDTVEFINVSQDDALSFPVVTHREYPPPTAARMKNTIQPFIRKSAQINRTLLGVFNKKLGLPEGTLGGLHSSQDHSCSESRCIRNPPHLGPIDQMKVGIGAHTDFGTLSFLHNRLGGLQVLVPGTTDWQYIKPLPEHAICNIGDALTIFSGGILRSNLHRVIPPPSPQNTKPRWSVVYFTRPGNKQVLNALVDKSDIISANIEKMLAEEKTKYNTNSTAKEWFARRIKNQRIKNRLGPETWRASRGMEHRPQAI